MSEHKVPIPMPRGGFRSHEDEARWLADTVAMRSAEAVQAIFGVSCNFPAESLYELLLIGLQSAAKRDVEKIKAELVDLQSTFDLRWEADMRAVARWRATAPERDLVLPDHADLVVWLMERDAAHHRRITELLEANNREVERRREAEHDAERFEAMLRAAVRLCAILGAPYPAEGEEDRATELERLIRQKAWEFLEETAKTCPDIVADSRGAGHA